MRLGSVPVHLAHHAKPNDSPIVVIEPGKWSGIVCNGCDCATPIVHVLRYSFWVKSHDILSFKTPTMYA